MELGPLLAAILISLLGLPHGALDPVLAYQHKLWRKLPGLVLFLGVYLLLASSVVLLWWAAPVLGLLIFLGFTAVHFGHDYQRHSPETREHLAYGGVILGLPLLFEPTTTTAILEYLLFGPAPIALIWILQFIGIVSLCYLTIQLPKHRLAATLELSTLVVAAALLDPLWFFVVFICGFHGPRHLTAVYATLNSELRFVGFVIMLFLTIFTLLASVSVAMRVESAVLALQSTFLHLLVIGVAALTVPHMVLIEWTRGHPLSTARPAL